jgi:hypothetical protein
MMPSTSSMRSLREGREIHPKSQAVPSVGERRGVEGRLGFHPLLGNFLPSESSPRALSPAPRKKS